MSRRSSLLCATPLARSATFGGFSAALVALPLALAPTGAGAANLDVSNSCNGTTTVCSANTILGTPPGNSGDVINFLGKGGVLTLDRTPSPVTYNQKTSLGTSTSTLDQDSHDTIFSGVISGSNITIENLPSGGIGSVTFNTTETYTGTTTINTGATLKLGSSGDISTSAGVSDAGTFDISAPNKTVTITSLSGAGTVNLSAGLSSSTLSLANASASDIFSGDIKGIGGVAVSKGTANFNNATVMSYSGATTIASGATLKIGGAGGIGNSSGVTATGTFDISGATGVGTTITSLSGASSTGSVVLGANTLTLSNASGILMVP